MRLVMATTNLRALEAAIVDEIRSGYMRFLGLKGEEAVEAFLAKDVGFIGIENGCVHVVLDGERQ